MVGNIVGKGENAGYQHFLLFPQCFQKTYVTGSLKVRIEWERFKRKQSDTLRIKLVGQQTWDSINDWMGPLVVVCSQTPVNMNTMFHQKPSSSSS